ncbi:bifunctional adenosylcobinamide kinase/adenosylcobinamide-phosphate guanylyltransferase [Paenibacillus soyae]|uniref:Adenosylcobinamide kinase n=1 Tax=Paenibacillus soyae TaxID=2969249 RepID=A0A9X2MRH3_9BACL|nr:bifunctional adenosylcobinamide kinase/adenosylcobinamide-phosphate guanylyltransferase [Paenibacillus soyae]MCR2805526.1 bifunctional adenosylcobinamide kinase/adenosylcobinamide-phosphate guanylyltransferase [Paenibacillus soyae]
MAILITGGARCGKSRFAEQYASRIGGKGVYVATCQAYDDEMRERIAKHREDREQSGFRWETIEEPFQVPERLGLLAAKLHAEEAAAMRSGGEWQPPVVLLDCMTLWLTNWLLREEEMQEGGDMLENAVDRLLIAVIRYPYPLLLVTNEVGDGIVPAYPLGRRFRDEAGRLNQRLAQVCDRVFLVTAGIPVDLKKLAFRWEELT